MIKNAYFCGKGGRADAGGGIRPRLQGETRRLWGGGRIDRYKGAKLRLPGGVAHDGFPAFRAAVGQQVAVSITVPAVGHHDHPLGDAIVNPGMHAGPTAIGLYNHLLAIGNLVPGSRAGGHLGHGPGPVPSQPVDVVHLAGGVEQIALAGGEDQRILLAQLLPALALGAFFRFEIGWQGIETHVGQSLAVDLDLARRGGPHALGGSVALLLIEVAFRLALVQVVEAQFAGLQQVLDQVLFRRPGKDLAHVHALAQPLVNIEDTTALAHRRDGLFADHQIGQAVADIVVVGDAPALQVAGGRQDVVGQGRGVGHELLVDHQQGESLESGLEGIGVGHGHHGIAAQDEKSLELVGNALRYHGDDAVGAGTTPQFVEEGILVGAQGLTAALGGEEDVFQGQARAEDPAAGDVDPADNGLQDRDGTVGLGAVGLLILGAGALVDRRPLGGGEQARQLADVIRRDPGDFLGPFRRVGLHMGHQLVESQGPAIDECLVVKVFIDDDMHHRQCQGAVGAGSDLQVHLGLVGQLDPLGVDHDDLGAAAQILGDSQAQGKIGLVGVVAPEKIEPGVEFLDRIFAEGDLPAADPHAVADTFHREVIGGAVGRPEAVRQGHHLEVFHAHRSAEKAQGLGAVLGLDRA
ncbi:hypothetical protein DESC_880062 [Desulfosarcina cetonica]|nr:hypothetical protein DESC_880062 [Desulfosarcina cetonica]